MFLKKESQLNVANSSRSGDTSIEKTFSSGKRKQKSPNLEWIRFVLWLEAKSFIATQEYVENRRHLVPF